MRKAGMLAGISLQYWRHHKKRLAVLMTALVLGFSALCCTALLIRSEKQALLEEELRLLGDYDIVAYSISDKTAERLRSEDGVEALGKYYELGFAEGQYGARAAAAAFADRESEEIYHMTCTKGRYPEKSNEVAMDTRTAKAMGITPSPGERVTLSLYSQDGGLISEGEYTLCGIFDSGDSMVYGGWYRYPVGMEVNAYDMPSVFFCSGFTGDTVTAFIQADETRIDALRDRISALSQGQVSIPNGRRFAYSYILGISVTIWDMEGGMTFENMEKALANGEVIKDFYSDVLMPVFTVIIFIIVVLSAISITGNILRDKQECFAVLSALGLEPGQLRAYIFLDLTAVGLVCTAAGAGLGALLHIVMIYALNSRYDLSLDYGFSASRSVRAVTYDPFLLAAATVLLCVLGAAAISVLRMRGKSPVELFEQKGRSTRKHRRHVGTRRGMLTKSLRLGNLSVAVVSILVMGSALFGYTYFRALADQSNAELMFEREEAGLGDWDYRAEKASQIQGYTFGIENRHDCGISREAFEDLCRQPFVKSAFGRIVNRSTRLSFGDSSAEGKLADALRGISLRQFSGPAYTDLDAADKAAEEAMVSTIGYGKDELICALPTVGYFDDVLSALAPYVTEGSIDLERLRAGEEILLVMTKYGADKYGGLFHVGDPLPLSDIVLSDEEDGYDFGSFDPSQYAEPVYRRQVTTPEGSSIELTSYAFGGRKDIPVKVGAVVVLDIDAAKQYMSQATSGEMGMNAFCSVDAFGAWGLSDSLLTDVRMAIDNDRSVGEADSFWYTMLAASKGMTGHSTSEIIVSMNKGTYKIMSVYYCMVLILTLIAAVTVAMSLYNDICIRSQSIAVLRACGLSQKRLTAFMLLRELIYPLLGAALSPLPIKLCMRFFILVRERIGSGEWDHRNTPWLDGVPFVRDLMSYNVKGAMAVIFGAYVLIMLISTLPPAMRLRRRSIAAEIEVSSF